VALTQKLKRILPATVLLLTAGHAVAISDTFTANGDEGSVSTRSQRLWELNVWAEMIGEDVHTAFEKGL
jgi:hypothetical protein